MITVNLLLLVLAFVCFAVDAWRSHSLVSLGLALLTLAMVVTGPLVIHH